MKEIIMDAGIISSIVLSLIGILKLPFGKFKSNHPKLYRFTFYMLSILIAGTCAVLAQLYVVCGPLWSEEFLMLILSTIAFVFGGYSTYENIALKNLFKKIIESLKSYGKRHSDNHVVKKVEKFINKVGIEKVEDILADLQNK